MYLMGARSVNTISRFLHGLMARLWFGPLCRHLICRFAVVSFFLVWLSARCRFGRAVVSFVLNVGSRMALGRRWSVRPTLMLSVILYINNSFNRNRRWPILGENRIYRPAKWAPF